MATKTDKLFLQALRPEIDAALAVIAKKHNLSTLHLGNGSFDPVAGTFSFKLEGMAEGALGKDAARYIQHCASLGLPERGAEFDSRGIRYRTDGINTAGSKVICERLDNGKKYDIPTDFVILAVKAQAVLA
jgi:hypothetical protein